MIIRADTLQLVKSSFYWCSNQCLMMSAQTVDFLLFIRSGRGASLSQHDCLNLTIVSIRNMIIHFFEYMPWKVNFRRSLLRKLKYFYSAWLYWDYKEKMNLNSITGCLLPFRFELDLTNILSDLPGLLFPAWPLRDLCVFSATFAVKKTAASARLQTRATDL